MVADLDLRVGPGERVLLIGPSGAGKSTVLRAAAGVLGDAFEGDPIGEVLVGGLDPRNASTGAGLLLQRPGDAVVADRIGRDVAFGPENVGLPRADVWTRVHEALDLVGLPYVDRLVVLGPDGRLLVDDTPARALAEHGDALAAAGLWVPGRPDPEPLDVAGLLPTPTPGAGVRTEDLHVVLRTRNLRGVRTSPAVRGADVEVTAATTALTGRSGAGKSTLLAALGGLLAPAAGQVVPSAGLAAGLDAPMHRWRSADLAARVGWVPQDAEHAVLTRCALDEVRLTADLLGRPVVAEALLDAFGLADRATTDPHRLSGGEQRRLAVLAGLAHSPALALLDEPTVGQDRHTWAAVTGLLRGLASAGGAVAVSTHDESLVDALAARRVHLDSGRVVL